MQKKTTKKQKKQQQQQQQQQKIMSQFSEKLLTLANELTQVKL